MRTVLLASFLAVVAVGCAEVKVLHVGADDKTAEGVHFYRPEPYLLVTETPPVATTQPTPPTAQRARTRTGAWSACRFRVLGSSGWT